MNLLRKSKISFQWKVPHLAGWLVLSFGTLFTVLLASSIYLNQKTRKDLLFKLESDRIIRNISTRISFYESVLIQTRAFFLSSDEITYKEFKNYVDDTEIVKRYRGILGIGFAPRVLNKDLSHFIRDSSTNNKDFHVWPETSNSVHYPVLFIEPQTQANKNAFGYDMYSEDFRRVAMDQAIATGEVILSEEITLVQNKDAKTLESSAAFNLYLAIHKTKENSKDKYLLGFVYAPFYVEELFDSISNHLPKTINYKIFTQKDNELREIYNRFDQEPEEDSIIKGNIRIAGSDFQIFFYPTELFFKDFTHRPIYLTLAVGFLSTFLFLLILMSKEREVAISKQFHLSEDKLQGIIQNMGEGLIIANSRGQMQMFNASALAILGFNDQAEIIKELEINQRPFNLFYMDDTQVPLNEWPVTRVLNGERFTNLIVQIEKTKQGKRERFFANLSGSPVYDNRGHVSLAIITFRDISFIIRAEKDLKKAIRSRDEFLSIASHELKTPLTSLKLQTQSIIRKVSKSEIPFETLVTLLMKNDVQIDRLARLVNDMLDLSKIEAGKLTYHFKMHNLKDLLMEVSDHYKEQFEDKGGTLHCDCSEDVWVSIDQERIEQVIINLLTNALKYGETKPVTLSLKKNEAYALIELHDQGRGIDKENYLKIFEKFERVISANEVSGFGVGLFITKEMVEAHGGKIWLESDPINGTTFFVELPLA